MWKKTEFQNGKIVIRTADKSDTGLLLSWDRHISKAEFESIIGLGRVIILECEGSFAPSGEPFELILSKQLSQDKV